MTVISWRRAGLAALLLLGVVAALPAGAAAQLSDADVFVAEATLAIEDKEWDKAIDLLRQALSKEPDHVEALYYLGVAHMGRKEPAEAVKVLERARAKSPAENSITYQLGLAYFALEQYDRARPLLEEVFAREPSMESLGYYVGFLRYRGEQYQDALKAFRAGRTADPSIAELTKLYAGLSLQKLGLTAQAEAELRGIGQLRPASPLTGPVERLKSSLSTARETTTPRRFRAEVKVGAFYDDNAAAEPDQRSDPDVKASRQNDRRTFGELFSLGLEYDWWVEEKWTGTAGFSFFGTHNNTLPSFDLLDYTGAVRITHRSSLFELPLQTGVSYTYDYLTLDNDELVQRHAVAAYAVLVESARHLTTFGARLEVKEYSETRPLITDEFQDAINYLVGIVHLVRFDRDRHFLKFGYQFDYDATRGRDFSYHGHRFIAGAQYTLPWGDVRLTYDFDLHYRDYLHTNAILPSNNPSSRERSDKEYTHTARVEVPLPWFTRDQAFYVTAEYTGKWVYSNLPTFEYTRNYAAVYFTWQY